MNEIDKYHEADKLSDIICDNFSLLMVMSRFGLSLGFGDKSVKEVCKMEEVDCKTFLAVANFINEAPHAAESKEMDFSLKALMEYLKQAHIYFLDFNLPTIRRKLIEAINCSEQDDVAYLILKFFDGYSREVRRHMVYENQSVFTYVDQLLEGNLTNEYHISTFVSRHHEIDSKLTELKKIIIKYYPEKENKNLLNSILFDIFNCEQDLNTHQQVEDYMFVPAVRKLEMKLEKLAKGTTRFTTPSNPDRGEKVEDSQETPSEREKEIIICVAKGMSNKEIADVLCLSIHTVITHRKNIARKLQIHSPSGLTIYAIVNKLVNLKDIK